MPRELNEAEWQSYLDEPLEFEEEIEFTTINPQEIEIPVPSPPSFGENEEPAITPIQESMEIQDRIEYQGEAITVIVPGEPMSGSQLQFNRKTGNAYRPKAHGQRVFTVNEYAKRVLEETGLTAPVFSNGTPVSFECHFFFPYRKADYGTGAKAGTLKPTAPEYVIGRKDIDNMLKPLKDGLAGVIYANDNQIVKYLEVDKKYSESPRSEIIIRPII